MIALQAGVWVSIGLGAASILLTIVLRLLDRRQRRRVHVVLRLVQIDRELWWRLTAAGGSPTATASVTFTAHDAKGTDLLANPRYEDLLPVTVAHGQTIHLPADALTFSHTLPVKARVYWSINKDVGDTSEFGWHPGLVATSYLWPEPF